MPARKKRSAATATAAAASAEADDPAPAPTERRTRSSAVAAPAASAASASDAPPTSTRSTRARTPAAGAAAAVAATAIPATGSAKAAASPNSSPAKPKRTPVAATPPPPSAPSALAAAAVASSPTKPVRAAAAAAAATSPLKPARTASAAAATVAPIPTPPPALTTAVSPTKLARSSSAAASATPTAPPPAARDAQFTYASIHAALQQLQDRLHISGTDAAPAAAAASSSAATGAGAASVSPPAQLLCRDKEHREISAFIEQHISESRAGTLYICGQPGTGKTLTVEHVLERTLPDLIQRTGARVVKLNAMRLRDANALFPHLCRELVSSSIRDGLSVAQSGDELHRIFVPPAASPTAADQKAQTLKPQKMIVLLIDEIDSVVRAQTSADQPVLSRLFGWPQMFGSRLILIGIANDMGLMRHVLPLQSKVNKKFVTREVTFEPYDHSQLSQIITQRVKCAIAPATAAPSTPVSVDLFHPAAIALCARKVGAVKGDVRRCLNICSQCTSWIETRLFDAGTTRAAKAATAEEEETVAVTVSTPRTPTTPARANGNSTAVAVASAAAGATANGVRSSPVKSTKRKVDFGDADSSASAVAPSTPTKPVRNGSTPSTPTKPTVAASLSALRAFLFRVSEIPTVDVGLMHEIATAVVGSDKVPIIHGLPTFTQILLSVVAGVFEYCEIRNRAMNKAAADINLYNITDKAKRDRMIEAQQLKRAASAGGGGGGGTDSPRAGLSPTKKAKLSEVTIGKLRAFYMSDDARQLSLSEHEFDSNLQTLIDSGLVGYQSPGTPTGGGSGSANTSIAALARMHRTSPTKRLKPNSEKADNQVLRLLVPMTDIRAAFATDTTPPTVVAPVRTASNGASASSASASASASAAAGLRYSAEMSRLMALRMCNAILKTVPTLKFD